MFKLSVWKPARSWKAPCHKASGCGPSLARAGCLGLHGLLQPDALVPPACLCLQFLTQDTLYRFPYFTTYSLDYTSDAVKMLGQLCTAVLLHPEVKEHITKLVEVAGEAKG